MSDPTKRSLPMTGRRLLFLLPFPPRLDALHGGGRATAGLLAELTRRHTVALLYLRAPGEPPLDPHLARYCAYTEEVMRPLSDAAVGARVVRRVRLFVGWLRGRPMWATDWEVASYRTRVGAVVRDFGPEIVQVEYHIMGQYLTALDAAIPRILVEHEPGLSTAQARYRALRGLARLVAALDLQAWGRFERPILRNVDDVVVFTDRDRRAVAAIVPGSGITTIPLGTAIPVGALDPLGADPLVVLFAGNYAHAPNVDAALRLARQIFPAIRARCPGVVLRIIGDAPPPALRVLACDGIVVAGRVPDVVPELARAAVVVAPLRQGGGMRVKVLEALAAGKAVVASPLAAAGLDTTAAEVLVLADTDADFADAVVALLTDPDRRAALARRARIWAVDNLGWDRAAVAYEALYARLLARRRGGWGR